MTVVSLQNLTSLDTVQSNTKIFELRNKYSELPLKLACAVIALFNSTIKTTTEKMNEVEIFESAELFTNKYTHESISDLMLCFKMIKTGELGIVYNRFDTVTLFQFFDKYLNHKYETFDKEHEAEKARLNGSVNTVQHTKMYQLQRATDKEERERQHREAVSFQQIYYNNLALLNNETT